MDLALSVVRKNPRKHAVVGKKTNPYGLVFSLLVVGCYQRSNGTGIAISGPDQPNNISRWLG